MMKQIISYSPPYGENYLKDLEVFAFMHECGIDTTKVMLCNSFSKTGVHYSPYPLIWQGPQEYHFEVVDRQLGDILKQNPEARFIPLIDLNSPPWLVKELGHDSVDELGECCLAPEWLKQVTGYVDALVNFLEKNYGDRIVAYTVICGRTQEWFDLGWCLPTPRRVSNYPKWCAARGRKVLAPPGEGDFKSCLETEEPVMPDHLVQWLEYSNSIIADCEIYFYNRLHSMIRPGIPVGAVFANVHGIYSHGIGSHLDAERICKEGRPDFFIGPSCNSVIPMGGASGFQSALWMLKRHGVGYLHSCDRQLSTSYTDIGEGLKVPATAIHARQKNAAEDVACLKREFALSLVHGFSIWFFNIWGGAYSGPEVRAALRRFGALWKEYAGRSSGSDAETLLVFSPEALKHCHHARMIDSQIRRVVLPEANIPFTTAVVNDLGEIDLTSYKMIVFHCVDYLSERDEKMLRERVLRNNRVVVWCNHPGVADEHGVRPERMERLCGAKFDPEDRTEKRKDFGSWKSVVFPKEEACTSEAFRAAGKLAGLHFFSEDPDLKIWSSPEFLSAHTRDGGVKEIKLKRKVRQVTEIFSGKVVGENCDSFTDEFAAPDTKLYRLEE